MVKFKSTKENQQLAHIDNEKDHLKILKIYSNKHMEYILFD